VRIVVYKLALGRRFLTKYLPYFRLLLSFHTHIFIYRQHYTFLEIKRIVKQHTENITDILSEPAAYIFCPENGPCTCTVQD
jgi:predicted nucleic acid-binding protein